MLTANASSFNGFRIGAAFLFARIWGTRTYPGARWPDGSGSVSNLWVLPFVGRDCSLCNSLHSSLCVPPSRVIRVSVQMQIHTFSRDASLLPVWACFPEVNSHAETLGVAWSTGLVSIVS